MNRGKAPCCALSKHLPMEAVSLSKGLFHTPMLADLLYHTGGTFRVWQPWLLLPLTCRPHDRVTPVSEVKAVPTLPSNFPLLSSLASAVQRVSPAKGEGQC